MVLALLAAAFFCFVFAAGDAAAGTVKLSGRIEEFHPKIKYSGRVNAIAHHPERPNEVLVTTERGGLHRSRDGGRTWTRVTSFPSPFAMDVLYHPADPTLVIATAERDFQNFDVIPTGFPPDAQLDPNAPKRVDPGAVELADEQSTRPQSAGPG